MFTPEEKKILEKYVTSAEEDVFVVRGMEGMAGAAYARYSRAKGGFREVILREFLKEGVIDLKHADELIERILIAYGDDSVGELEGAHVSFENISTLATKEIEDRRIGGSPIEQSTRYVFYDQKMESGAWRYLRAKDITEGASGALYVETMDFIFETYASLVEPMKAYFGKLMPLEDAEYDINGDGAKERYETLKDEKEIKAFKMTYGADLRTKACDSLRSLLPLSTLTNVGVFGNGRFFQSVISHLYTSDIPEAQDIGKKAYAALHEIIPQYVRRSARSEYQVSTRRAMRNLSKRMFGLAESEKSAALPEVVLLDMESYEVASCAAMMFPFTNLSLQALRKKISAMGDEEQKEILKTYEGERKTRRDRPGRGLEEGYPLTFDLVTNWGVYKDLMRHRMNTQQRQLFTPKIGFDMPEHLVTAGFEARILECAHKSEKLFDALAVENPVLAQYSTLHGHFVRWTLGMNAREAMHLIELRTTPQGHAQYRRIAQMMHKEILKKHPAIAQMMKFTDYNSYESARGDSEARQRVKEQQLEEKFKNTL